MSTNFIVSTIDLLQSSIYDFIKDYILPHDEYFFVGPVLLQRDQHFIERESYRSGREMALEIQDKS